MPQPCGDAIDFAVRRSSGAFGCAFGEATEAERKTAPTGGVASGAV
jgi:hypothetical protein